LKAGEAVAVVGDDAAGGTTLAGLLARQFDPDFGTVLIDGVNLRSLGLRNARQMIGLVDREAGLFEGSIFANIAAGKRSCTREEVLAAARKAGVRECIDRLPHGFETRFEEAGLTPGDRMRVLLARTILRNPSVLVVDATRDPGLAGLLADPAPGQTVVAVIRRPAAAAAAAKVVVMDAGRVVDVGSHAELSARCPVYRRLADAGERKAA
jgi:ABC-type multidrug transport system fused ATPase/permease subunit